MRLCMFHPADHPLERGWVGRIAGERVTQLAAQTLQSFFTGGGSAREHAVFPLAEVRLLAPVLHPPAVRLFSRQDTFEFANPAAICGPNATAKASCNDQLQGGLGLLTRLAGVVGAEEEIAGFTLLAEWRDPSRRPPKDRDFALGLGPFVVTPDELDPDGLELAVRVDGAERARGRFAGFDWTAARTLAAAGTRLYPGDVLAGPAAAEVAVSGERVEIEVPRLGVLEQVQAQASER